MKKWLDKYETKKAQNGIEGTMGGLTDKGFNYNSAWGGQFQNGGKIDEAAFQEFFKTLPSNLRNDSPEYNIRGFWDALGRPKTFDYTQPKEDDGYYHAFSRHPETGEILKRPSHPTFKMAIEKDRKAGYFPIVTPEGTIKTVTGKMAMGGSLPGSVGFTYARTAGAAPSNGPYAKKTKASAQNGEVVADNTRVARPIDTRFIERDRLREIESVEPQDTRPFMSDSRAKERGDALWNAAKKATAAGQFVPNPLVRYPSIALNSIMGAADAAFSYREGDMTNAKINAVGAIPLPGYGSIKALRSAPGLNTRQKASIARTALGTLGIDLFGTSADLTDNFGLEKKRDGGNMSYYQNGLDWRPKTISQDGSQIPSEQKSLSDAFYEGLTESPEAYQYPGRIQDPEKRDAQMKNIFFTLMDQYKDPYLVEAAMREQNQSYGSDRLENQTLSNYFGYDYSDIQPENLQSYYGEYMKEAEPFLKEEKNGGWLSKYEDGGDVVKDDMGYWNPENRGKVVEIDSPYITMEGVYEPLVGVSDTGDIQYMEPGGQYEFEGSKVTEYPIKKNGGWLNKYK